MEAGCRKVKIEPHLGDLEWAEGAYPTPYGIIRVEHRKMKDGSIDTRIDAPREIEIYR